MIQPMFVAGWIACCALLLVAPECPGVSPLDARPLQPAAHGADSAPAPLASSANITVVLLGTGVGPPVNLQQYGTSTLVEAGGQRFLFDCGRGAMIRLKQARIPSGSITRVFLTHLHSDHVLGLPDLLLTGWAEGRRRYRSRSGGRLARAP